MLIFSYIYSAYALVHALVHALKNRSSFTGLPFLHVCTVLYTAYILEDLFDVASTVLATIKRRHRHLFCRLNIRRIFRSVLKSFGVFS